MHRKLLLFLGVLCASFVIAHVRLIYSANGNVLFWTSPGSISFVINETGSADVPDDGHMPALRNAVQAWNDVTGTSARLWEDVRASEQASTDWQSDARHMVYFDETNTSGYFPGASGIVAVTPLTFYTSGEIIDADILFNGKNFLFTTSGTPGRFDIQDVAAHEFGHLLGLDHTGCAGGTMYPYVDPTVILHRSLSLDDVHGLQHMYPAGTYAMITGTLQRTSDNSAVAGAWVGARDANGRVVGAVLSNSLGQFYLPALTTGTYEVYATPLEDPVSSANLTAGHVIHTDFEARVLGSIAATAGSSVSMGIELLDADVSVELGRVADDYPLRAVRGQGNALTVRGSGLVAGSSLTSSDPSVTISGVSWGTSSVSFTATPLVGAAPGHIDLMVSTPGGEDHILSAGVEITPPDPTVTTVVPGVSSSKGGTDITITGTGFNPGALVVIGDQRYSDSGGTCTVVDANTITLTTRATIAGTHDVVVIDSTGVEGRDPGAMLFTVVPEIDVVFPIAGDAAGGTMVTINGCDFVAGSFVTIDGTLQPNLTIVNETRMEVVTEPGVIGGPYVLQVETPGGQTASSAFVYSSKRDPVVASVSPGSGSSEGGETVTLTGSNFTANTEVIFGAVLTTGLGGVAASNVVLVSPGTLQVTTPPCTLVSGNVMVREDDTGQATALASAFHFETSSSGGGCAATVPAPPPTWPRVLGGAGWLAVLAFVLAWRARRSAGRARLVTYAAWPVPND